MNPRVTWFLLLVALGLGGYLYVAERRPGIAVTGADGTQVRFLPVAAEQVTAVELFRSNGIVRAERTDKDWMLRLPVAYAAQGQAVDALLNALAKMRPRSWIPGAQLGAAGSETWKAFGLDDSAATLKLETKSGPVIFKFGATAPLGRQFYFQPVGSDGVFTADNALLDLLPASADDWRNRSLVNLRGVDFDRVELRGKTAFEAVRDRTNGVWRLTKPLVARADGDRLNKLLQTLASVRVAQFVTDSPLANLDAYGLQTVDSEVIIGNGTNQVARLQFGASPTNQPGALYVRRMAQTNIVLVPAATAVVLRGPLSSFRDHRLLPPLADSTRVEFTVGEEHTVVEQSGTNWLVTSPAKFPARNDQMERLFALLAAVTITDFPNDVVADYAPFGLAKPARTYTFTRGTNAPLQLQFGARADTEHVFVRRLDEPGVYVVRLTDLLQLPESPEQIRDFRFGSSNVVSIAIRQKGNARTLGRGVGGQWAITAGNPGDPFTPAIEETLRRLGDLESVPYAVRNEAMFTQLKSYAELGHEVTLTFAPGSPLRTLRLRFAADLGAVAVALANFDDDPLPLRIELPGKLFQDILHYFSAF
jgi:hypothetical protein